MYTEKAEMKAGLVVLTALAVLLGGLYIVSGQDFGKKTRDIRIRFTPGFVSPKEGDPVHMNGFAIGRVLKVEQVEERRGEGSPLPLTLKDRAALKLKDGESGTAREIYVLATARLAATQKVPQGTTARISETLTGTRKLDLLPGVSTVDLSDADTEARPILAESAGDLNDIQRSVQELLDRVTELIGTGQLALGDVRSLIATVQRKVDSVQMDLIQGNIVDASGSLKEVLASVKAKVDDIGGKISLAADNVRTMSADGSTLVKNADAELRQIAATLREVLAEVKGIVARASPKIDALLDDVSGAGRSVAALGKDIQALGPRLHALLGDTAGGLDGVLASFAETGHNLADASEDLRAHPWKLLNKPDEKEIAFENLRNAAQNYVRASARIEQTTKELQDLLNRTDLPEPEVKDRAKSLLERLNADKDKYEDAERRFRDMLNQGGGPPARTPK